MRRLGVLFAIGLIITLPKQAQSEVSVAIHPLKSKDIITPGQFSPAERHLIRTYLASGKRLQIRQDPAETLPSGLHKKGMRGSTLPPGWQKELTIGHTLDYHVYQQKTWLPTVLLEQLPQAPPHTEICQIGNMIIRTERGSRIILDFFNLRHGGR